MKTFLFLLFTLITIPAFSQDAGNRGTIKVKKVVADTGCVASVLGYTGRNFITKAELVKARNIDLNEGCNCEISEFVISFVSRNTTSKYVGQKNTNTFDLSVILKNIGEITFVKFLVIIKDKNSGKEIKLPRILFDLVNEK